MSSLDVHDDESLIAAFQTRPAAEQVSSHVGSHGSLLTTSQAFSKGPDIPPIGEVKLSWYNETGPVKTTQSLQATSLEKKVVDDSPSSPRADEVPEETGWGNEEDTGRF